MSSWERIAALPLSIERYELEGLEAAVSSEFVRKSTVIRLFGAGETGLGEDVTYDAVDQEALQAAGPSLPLAGDWTLASFSARLGELELFPRPPEREPSRRYRVWAYESAAADLALRQAGISLAQALGRESRPVTFVVSLRLGDPPSLEPLSERLERYPGLRFKIDPTSSWDERLIAELRALDRIDVLDLKGLYEGSIVDQGPDPELYGRVAEAFPSAWLEDPALTPQTTAVLEPYRDRITWDANIHSVADIEALPFAPRMLNMKPSRLGGWRSLLDAYDHCAAHGIGVYGGGQFELGVGRGQIQYLASLFGPDAPNDVAPSGFNATEPGPGLPTSPLEPSAAATGFRWG